MRRVVNNVGQALAARRNSRSIKPKAHLRTTVFTFALWWIGLLIFHAANVAYYAGFAKLYTITDGTFFEYQLELYSIGIAKSEYGKISKIHATVAALHAFFIITMVATSVIKRKLAFQPNWGALFTRAISYLRSTALFKRVKAPNSSNDSASRRPSRRFSSFSRVGSEIFARDGILGVDSVYFDHVLLIRELVETSLQTYQLYRMTQVLPRLWLIRMYVALLVANCWVVPFLHKYYRNRETLRRMMCLLCDATLDMVSSMGVSVIILAQYAPQYTDPQDGFPFTVWFDDEWFSNMQQEFQMLLVVSWGDMLSRLVFALGLIQCMDAIKELLTPLDGPKPPDVAGKVYANTKSEAAVSAAPKTKTAVPAAPVNADTTQTKHDEVAAAKAASYIKENKKRTLTRVGIFLVHRAGPALFVVWGFVILIVHLMAESNPAAGFCKLRLKPWLSKKQGCSLLELNCATLESSGQDKVMDSAWDAFDPNRAARVAVRHCPEFVMSPKIQRYHQITGLKVYNSTIAEWAQSAALEQSAHGKLRTVFMVRTQYPQGELPPGLTSSSFPRTIVGFVSSVTNLRVIPSDLDTKWPKAMQLVLENSQLTALDPAVSRMMPNFVSVSGSPLATLPASLVENPVLSILQVTRSRIQELPRNVSAASPILMIFFLQYTNVSTFWSWIDNYARFATMLPYQLFNAFDTPYCRELLEIHAGNRTAFSVSPQPDHSILMDVSTPEKIAFAMKAVKCTAPDKTMYFPLPVEDAKHSLH